MRQSSVQHTHINQIEKEKLMRKSITASLALVLVLAIGTPAVAAPRDRSVPPSLTAVVKKLVLKLFGIGATGAPTIPTPDQPPTEG